MSDFQKRLGAGISLLWLFFASATFGADSPTFQSHTPTRPLPTPADRPLATGPAVFVDAVRGDDTNPGTMNRPWKTVSHAGSRLQPGETLYLRGGTYFEHAVLACRGTREAPITICSYPGELAVINGGLRDFVEHAPTAWEPCPEGVAGEFRSLKTYPGLADAPDGCNLLGNFADSMLPLQGYRFLVDLRDPSMVWDVESKGDGKEGVYCGPGIFYSVETGRIHVRLAHTDIKALHEDNYRGETDPRKLSLIVAGLKSGPALTLRNCRYLRLQDLVVCGARTATIDVSDCQDIRLDGLTVYGGYAAISVGGTTGLRLYNTACRGIAAPWTFRGHLKYRATEARIFSASEWSPTGRENQDFELAYSEFTDCVDGVFIGNVRNVHFHHNLLDNVSDDGLFLTAGTAFDGTTFGGEHFIYQNLLSRCLTTFAFGVGHGRQKMTAHGRQTGSGVWIYRNVFDFRRPVHYGIPADTDFQVTTHGRMANDHGSPAWEPLTIYQNTIVEETPMKRDYYLSDLGAHTTGCGPRKLFNNIAVQVTGNLVGRFPPVVLPGGQPSAIKGTSVKTVSDPLANLLDGAIERKEKPESSLAGADLTDRKPPQPGKSKKESSPPQMLLQADGNLHWGFVQKPDAKTFFHAFRTSADFAASQRLYDPGWTTQDVVANPEFMNFSGNWRELMDLRIGAESPAKDAGVELPADWPDPLRAADQGKPDIGALPAGAEPWRVGVRGRLTLFGDTAREAAAPRFSEVEFPKPPEAVSVERKPAALIQGYPAFDAEFVHFVLAKQRVPTIEHAGVWLNTNDYAKYRLVVIVGDLVRSKMTPNLYTEADLENVHTFMKQGGTLWIMRTGRHVFDSQPGRFFLGQLAGGSNPRKSVEWKIRLPEHPWLKHLDLTQDRSWISARSVLPLLQDKGETLIGSDDGGAATLLRVAVGKGQFIYLGWELSDFLPHGRQPSTVESEREFEEQIQILKCIVADVYPSF